MPATIHHDPTCPTLNAHRVTDGLGRELWAVWCDQWHWHGPLGGGTESHTAMTRRRRTRRVGTTFSWWRERWLHRRA
jgi:hypothetical protein